MGQLIPLFWTFGNVCPGYKSQGGYHLHVFSCLHATPQIHLWCDTCQPLDGHQAAKFPTCIFQQRYDAEV